MYQIGLQLYSIKEQVEQDLLHTLKLVSDIGYEGVEFAGMPKISEKEVSQSLKEHSLIPAGIHIEINELKNNLNQYIKYCKELHIPAIVCPYLSPNYFLGEEQLKGTAMMLSEIGEQCKKGDILFLYHIHGTEFQDFNGMHAMDWLIQNTDPEKVNYEMDTFWVTYANVDALEFYKKYGTRIPYLHFKDMNNHTERKDTEVGYGVIDMKGIMLAAEEFHPKWIIVEQEDDMQDPIVSIEKSCKFVKGGRDRK